MPLKPLPYREAKRKLEAAGFKVSSQKESHVKFVARTNEGTRTSIAPRHREVTIDTIRSIIRQIGLTLEEFERL